MGGLSRNEPLHEHYNQQAGLAPPHVILRAGRINKVAEPKPYKFIEIRLAFISQAPVSQRYFAERGVTGKTSVTCKSAQVVYSSRLTHLTV